MELISVWLRSYLTIVVCLMLRISYKRFRFSVLLCVIITFTQITEAGIIISSTNTINVYQH